MRNARKEWKIKYAKEWKIEYAKTSRSSCRTCRKFIKKEVLRLGKVIPATKYDGVLTKWNHAQCILKRPNKISSLDDVEGIDLLRWEDQKRMRRYVQTGIFFNTITVGVNECSIEVSQTARAVCKLCNKKITQGEIRISTKPGGEGTSTLAWHHAYCYMEWSHSTSVENLSGWNSLTLANQGDVHAYANKGTFTGNRGTNCLVVGEELDCEGHDQMEYKDHFQILRARRLGLPILRLEYLTDCTRRQKRLPLGQYLIEPSYKDSRGSVTLKVNGNCIVHETSGMQGYSHILEDAKYIYSTTLNKSDLSIGVNSYYVMQIIQEDKRPNCYLFREWGRIGNEQIGGNKLDEMSKAGAIREFKRLFLEKTGNPWEAWEKKENFQKQPGKYFPLDIDYGISEQVLKIKEPQLPSSRLAQPVQNLMKMLFDVETYRSAMIELEINMSEMPLGKLSKSNIQMGFSALTDIQNLLASNNPDLSVRESLLIDASNRFFSIIPSTHPRVIRNENDLKSKVEMLEALQDIEIASRIVGFNAECDESLDAKYEKLHCNILPLPRDSDDYLLVEKYLLTTHASRHKEWMLELEDVFALDREGEFDKFAPYREKLQNKMLLWHGSRLTNFVGILSHGLRIAPPEVPSSGYMFGKGIYFADLVSKSAQYCRTSNWNPLGLLLLSEVALGDVYELKESLYMEKPPEGKNSTKGLGKKAPQKSDFVTWKNNVVVPCGKPVTSNARTSELMYNEYIVYDTAQVKMQFLVKVRFHHKR
ncbi:hypothetical protein MKW92_030016 [Papaver armeniacum]|nr:hypothetical protein MKW92_030016 [Papaver armeniacum]